MVQGQNFGANGNIFIYFNVLIFYNCQLLIFQYFLNKKGFTAQGLLTVKRSTSVFFTNTRHPDLYKTAIIIIVMRRMITNNYWMRFL